MLSIIDFVKEKHKDQTDKAGQPYISHLMRVADKMQKYSNGDSVIDLKRYIIALLHDIFEDTDATEEDVKKLPDVDELIINTVKLLTRSKDDTYMQYIEKVSKNRLATEVKLADLEDNMDITRLDKLDDDAFSLLKRYHKAWKYLSNKIEENAQNN